MGFWGFNQGGDMLGYYCSNMAKGLRKNISLSRLEILTWTSDFDTKYFFRMLYKVGF